MCAMRCCVARAALGAQDRLGTAGQALFGYRPADYGAWRRSKDVASAVVLYDVGSLDLVRRYSSVDVDADGRLVSFVEKPAEPSSTLVATAAYLYHREHLPLIRRYVDERNPPHQPGPLDAWP